MSLVSVIVLIIRSIYCHKNYEEVVLSPKKHFSKPLFNEMSSFAGWSLLGCSTSMVGAYGQGIVLNIFFGSTINAAQGVATQVRSQLSAFGRVLIKALNPVIAKSEGAGDRNLMLRASMLGSKISFFLLVILYVPVMVEMHYIFSLWLTYVPEYTIIFCNLLLIRGLIEQQTLTLRTAIGAVGNIRRFEMFNAPLLLLPLLFSWIFFKLDFPPYTLYLIYIIFELFNSILIIIFAWRECKLSISNYLKDVVARCTGSFILILAISSIPLFIFPEGIIRLMIVILVSFMAFLFFGWFLGPTNKERKHVKDMATIVMTRINNPRNNPIGS